MSKRLKSASLWYPQNLLVAVGIVGLRALARWPAPSLQSLGRGLGRLMWAVYPYRRKVAEVNIALCFPELSATERAALVKGHYEAMGMGLFELGMGWYQSWEQLQPYTELVGLEHLQAVRDSGRGALMLTPHVTTLEICGRIVKEACPFSCLYRRPNQPRIAREMTELRRRHMRRVIHQDQMNELIKALREGELVWFAPDQGQRIKYSELLPFFGVPAVTNTATVRIARMGRATILPFAGYRLPNGHYRVQIEPARDDLVAMEPAAAALEINRIFERFIRLAPEQYFWLHRRFKGRGADLPDVYRDA